MRRSWTAAVAAILTMAAPASAQSPGSRVAVSGYVQAQYERVVHDDAETTDRAYLRRALFTVDAVPVAHWEARLQFDLGPATTGGSVLVRDAVLRYTGWEAHGLTLTIGNQKLPFSRSYLLPATRRGLIERPATGARSLATPGRTLSLRLDGHSGARRLQWAASVGSARHRPDSSAVRIDGSAEAGDDWNEGVVTAGRIEWHPLGDTPRDQGWFGGPPRAVVGVGGYTWHNDGDRNPNTLGGRATSPTRADLGNARVLEVSAGFRGRRTSLDAEYHRLRGRTLDPAFTGGLYRGGDVRLQTFSLEGGVMLLPRRLEGLAAIDGVTAEAEAATTYGPAVGATYYVAGHNLKFSVMHRLAVHDRFVRGAHTHSTYAQAQIVF